MVALPMMGLTEIPYTDPVAIFSGYADQPYSIFLDSALAHPVYGRYSYIAVDPIEIVTARPFERLAQDRGDHLWFGYLGYELYHYNEDLPAPRGDLPECWLGLYESVDVYDHVEKRGWRWSAGEGWREGVDVLRSGRSEAALPGPCESSKRPEAPESPAAPLSTAPQGRRRPRRRISTPSLQPREIQSTYLAQVRKVLDYLRAGDCYQVNLSQRFTMATHDSPWEIYQRLRSICPTPYAAFINCGDFQVLSASPECFLKIENGRVVTRPIKGTRPRGSTPEEDAGLKEELVMSRKDRAELLMIVDLERNDLGRVCRTGSVCVSEIGSVESYANVHHLVATVQGELKEGMRPLDVIVAAFPGGSITGAPKVRAMQIIHELEGEARGVYTGAIGWIGRETAHLNIAIRTMVIRDGVASFRAGGGIVIDSDPDSEYQELVDKATPLRLSLCGAAQPPLP